MPPDGAVRAGHLDGVGACGEADEAAPGLGFEAMETEGIQGPGGSYLVWAPGLRATESKHTNPWSLSRGTSLVLQLHRPRAIARAVCSVSPADQLQRSFSGSFAEGSRWPLPGT